MSPTVIQKTLCCTNQNNSFSLATQTVQQMLMNPFQLYNVYKNYVDFQNGTAEASNTVETKQRIIK